MVELVSDEPRERGLLHHVGPIEKQVVIVEDVVALFCFHIAAKELLQFTFPFRAPREVVLQRSTKRARRVQRVRIDRKACFFPRETRLLLRQAKIVADEVETIRRIGTVENSERRIKQDRTLSAYWRSMRLPIAWNVPDQ